MKKRILSVVLGLIMCLGLLPTVAMAQEEEPWQSELPTEEEITEATAEAKYKISSNGETWGDWKYIDYLINAPFKKDYSQANYVYIELLKDITTGSTWQGPTLATKSGQHVVLDGNGKTIKRGAATQLFTIGGTDTDSYVTMKNITLDGGAIWSGDDPATRTNSGLSCNGTYHLISVTSKGTLYLDSGVVLQNSNLATGSGYGAAVSVYSAGKLVMKEGAKIQNNQSHDGSVIVWSGGTFTMEGGDICDNYAESGGGGVNIQGGTFTMSAGTIAGNASGNNGGGLCIATNGTGGNFTMSGGEISGNSSTVGGGGVTILSSGSSFTMTGGSITGNSITGKLGGGVLVNDGTMTVSGSPIVTGNTGNGGTPNNAYLQSNKTIDIGSGGLSSGAEIGVSAPDGATIPVSDQSDTNYFTSDNPAYEVQKDSNGKVQLVNTKPTAPTITNVELGNEKVKITWTAPAATGGSQITKYQVSYDDVTWMDVDKDATTYTFENLVGGQKYTFQVRAVSGEESTAKIGVAAQFAATPNATVYTVTFDAKGGTCDPDSVETENYKLTSPLPTPTWEGYTFGGWYTDEACTTEFNIETEVKADLPLYAKWTAIPSAPSVPTYTVTAPTGVDNGKITVSPKYAVKNSTVTITVTPDEGYVLSALTVTDAQGSEIELTDQGGGKYTFKMPGSKVSISASFERAQTPTKPVFTDVAETDYFYDAVQWAVENGITTGATETTFEPNASCTRAQAVTFLWRAAGCPEPETADSPFGDVQAGPYYGKAVQWAVEQGITNGTAADQFSPDETCTRAQIVTFLWRAAGEPEATGDMPFTDVAQGQYYEDAVQWAVDREITNGTAPDKFSPNDDCTRGQIVTFLYRDRTK